ncbi:MAG: peptidylprolyl isomerase [Ruminococcus sp.]|nr:peptidylprolyl isomerase [Ruminococcus sp.]
MKKFRKAAAAFFGMTFVLSAALCGCAGGGESSKQSSAVQQSDNTNDEAYKAAQEGGIKAAGADPDKLGIKPEIAHDAQNAAGYQLEKPKDGDTIAVVQTSMGSFSMRLFENAAPKTAANFKKLAEAGKYDGTIFHRVVKDFVVQGGHIGTDENRPNGESADGKPLADEFNDKLYNLRGAVAMANNGKDTNGSQFFVNQQSADVFQHNGGWSFYDGVWKECLGQIKQYKDNDEMLTAYIDENGDRMINTDLVPKDVKALYVQHGGNPNLDGAFNAADRGNTVFAQVYDGMDVIDKIAAVAVDDKNVPKQNVVIKSVKIGTYKIND